MSGDRVWTLVEQSGRQAVDAVTAATPLALLPLAAAGESASRILGDAGYTFQRLFVGNIPGSVCETSALMCMLGAVFLALLLQLAVIYVPALNPIFHTQPLPLADLAICLALSSLVLFVVEIEKWLIRKGYIYAAA